MTNNEEIKKKKIKITKTQIAGKIIATLMVIFMLMASCSTVIYYIINK